MEFWMRDDECSEALKLVESRSIEWDLDAVEARLLPFSCWGLFRRSLEVFLAASSSL